MSIDKIITSLPQKTPAEREKMKQNALAILDGGDDKRQPDAQKLLTAVEAFEQKERNDLIGELKDMPVAQRIIRAFQVEPMTPTEAKIIQVLLDNPGTTNRDLSRLLGWKDNGFDLHFGVMCKNREVYLWPAQDSEIRDGKFFTGILAQYDNDTSQFTMKPDVAAAFAQLGLQTTC